MKDVVLVAGGSGLVGQVLTEVLLANGYKVNWLSRNPANVRAPKGVKTYGWDADNYSIDTNAFDGVSIVVNLAGQSIAGKRWTKEYKNKILQSRVNSSLTLIKGLEESGAQLDLFIGASAVGYYGMKLSNHRFAEDDLPGNDFWQQHVLRGKKTMKNSINTVNMCQF